MIKNLIYGALAAGAVATVTVTAVIVSSDETKQSHKMVFNANGGTFSAMATCWTNEVNLNDCMSNVFNDVERYLTWPNHDLLGWTNATGQAVCWSESVTNYTNTVLYASWSVEKHQVTNGVYVAGSTDKTGKVMQFPVVFHGAAEWSNRNWCYPAHRITFVAPRKAVCRLSFDPQTSEDARSYGITLVISNRTSHASETYKFGDATYHVDFSAQTNAFENGVAYDLLLDFGTNNTTTIRYALGIGLDGVQVRFDPTDGGYFSGEYRQFMTKGANYTVGYYPYGVMPTPTADAGLNSTFLGWSTTEDESGVTVDAKSFPVTNETLYAHWKFSSYVYHVDFHGGPGAVGVMLQQDMESNTPTALYRNSFYKQGHRFDCWTNSLGMAYENGAVVTNLCLRPNDTNHLYAAWVDDGTTNRYVVSSGHTVFTNGVVSVDAPVYVEGVGTRSGSWSAALPFALDITNMTNSAICRVAIDPASGFERLTNVVLFVDQWMTNTSWKIDATNGWSQIVRATEFDVSPINYPFTNGVYRFRVMGVASNEAYVVSIGARGEQVEFEPYVSSVGEEYCDYNWTVGSPYGYLPLEKGATDKDYGTLIGWYDGTGPTNECQEVLKTIFVPEETCGTNTVYARWSKFGYSVKFDPNPGTNTVQGSMSDQLMHCDVAVNLNRNLYYIKQHRFAGWATNSVTLAKVYDNEQLVTNLCNQSGGICTLYAVWDFTPGTNWYYVAGGMTNFGTIAVSQGSPAYFFGKGDTTQFMVTTTNVAKCRVALDPQEGFSRTGAKLTIDCAEIPTNKTEKLEWENACEVTDLSDKEVKCSFTTNHYYRFVISGLASTTNGYVVSIGAEGARYIFDACGGYFADVTEKQTTTMLKFFNWTVGSPIGYLPTLTTNKYVHGRYEWHYTPLINETDETTLVCTTNAVVSGGDRIYAIWPDSVIVGIVFDWNMTATNIVFTNYYAQGNKSVDIYDEDYVRQPTWENHGFLGWTTNRVATANDDWDVSLQPMVTTNSPNYFYAQWTDKWKTSRTTEGLSIDGYFGTLPNALVIPDTVEPCPKPVVAVGNSAFTNCLFTSLNLPATLTSIGDSAFSGCSAFATLDIPETVTYLGSSAFEDCTSLKTVTFPTVEVKDEYATSGFLDGIFDGGTPTVELGECLFKGCTALKDVHLPLGVNCIPNECFSGCTAMTEFADTPYTVIEIGTEAFYGCTHLTNVVFTEIVDVIGESAFKKCARLKFVSFIGDQPESVESDIFAKTPRNVLVRYLENMCTTAKDYCGGSWPELPGTWPSGDDAKTLTWLGGKYPRRKVVFNHNDNDVLWKSTQTVALYHEGRVFGLLAPTEDEMNGGATTNDADDEEEDSDEMSGFTGWYTQPMGGRKIGSYWEVPTASEGDSAPITVYAHWGNEDGEGAEAGSRSYGVYWPEEGLDDFSGFYTTEDDETGGDDMFYYSACTFNGIVFDVDNNAITGTVAFVFEDATYPADGGMESKFTATVTWNTGKTTTISGVADAEGYLVAKGNKWSLGKEGEDHRTVITKSGINGWLSNEESEYRIYAARNRTAQATDEGAARTVVLTGLQATKGTWHVVLETEDPQSVEGKDDGTAFANGYSTLSITLANMGQATITGTLGDGTAVNTSSTLIIGDGCCCLPVCIRPYGGKGGFAFMVWFTWQNDGGLDADDASIQGLTEWDASMSSHPFTAKLTQSQPLTFIDEKLYSGAATFDPDGIAQSLKIDGKVWKVDGDNTEHKLQLQYNDQSGVFSGSYVTGEGRASVKGVFTDRITVEGEGSDADVTEIYHGFGTAVIKDVGSAQIEIRTEE